MANSRLQFAFSGYYRFAEVVATLSVAVVVHPAVVFGFYANTRKNGYLMLMATLSWAFIQLGGAGPVHPYQDVTPLTFARDLGDFLFPGLIFFLSGMLMRNINRLAPDAKALVSPGGGPATVLGLALMLAASGVVFQQMAADFRASVAETRYAQYKSTMGLYEAWNSLRAKEKSGQSLIAGAPI
jgi:hypothetical protein